MLINHSWYNFLENTIFDFQITKDRVHPVQISSCSDNCITTDIMPKKPFARCLDNVDIIMYMKFQKILMTWCRDMGNKHEKWPQNSFSPFVTPQNLYQQIGITLVHLWCKTRQTTHWIQGD